jgi:hypothetical protein
LFNTSIAFRLLFINILQMNKPDGKRGMLE